MSLLCDEITAHPIMQALNSGPQMYVAYSTARQIFSAFVFPATVLLIALATPTTAGIVMYQPNVTKKTKVMAVIQTITILIHTPPLVVLFVGNI